MCEPVIMSHVRFGILTVSDRCSRGEAVDDSGPALSEFIKNEFKGDIVAMKCVPDEALQIRATLLEWSDLLDLDIILTTGGTGFSPRDITPDVTKYLIEREAPGMVIAMMQGSLNVTPMAMLSRPQCGIRKNSIIINLPGSKKGALENFKFVAKQLLHAVRLIRNETRGVSEDHKKIQGQGSIKSKVDEANVAERPRISLYKSIPVPEALSIVLKACDVKEANKIHLREGYGHIISEDIFSGENIPPFPASIKDGYAVYVTNAPMSTLNVIGHSTAGEDPEKSQVREGHCVRISTGAPVPKGANAVIMVEDTELIERSGKEEKTIKILKKPEIGQDIREIGSDVKTGDKILERGSFLGAAEIGILASVGVTNLPVFKKPKIAILSTGNELQSPYDKWEFGRIRDSNKITLQTIFKEHNIPTCDLGIAKDNPDDVLKKLVEGLDQADIVVSTGGVSMGEKDFLKQVLLTDLNAEIHFASVLMKPGKPTTFATLDYKGKRKFVFGLPGNPVSSTVTCVLFVLPAIRQMSGYQNPDNFTIKAKIERKIKLDKARPEYHRVVLKWSTDSNANGYPIAQSTGNQLSSRLMSCNSANGLALLPRGSDDKEFVDELELVDVILLSAVKS